MLIASRNGFAVSKRSILPPGARWVEYLESTGTQWIDTGLNSTTDGFCDFEIAFRKTTMSGQYSASPFGYMYGATARYAMWGGTNGADNNLYVGVNASNNAITQIDTAWHLFRLRNGVAVELDGVSTPIGQGTVRSNISMALFATNRSIGGPVDLSLVSAQISMLKIWNTDDNLLRDFRPIAIGNTGYMLDLLTGEYEQYGNKGEGEFVIGPDVKTRSTGGATDDKRKWIKLVRKLFSKAVFRTHALRTCTKEVAA